jgi:site-specific recombinase XerD
VVNVVYYRESLSHEPSYPVRKVGPDQSRDARLPTDATLGDLIDTYVKLHAGLKKSFATHYRGALDCIGHFFGRDLALNAVTPLWAEAYKADLMGRGLTPATINKRFSCLKHLFSKAVSWRFMNENPAESVGNIRENNKRVRYLSGDEYDRLVANCSPKLRTIVDFVRNTGLRKGELRALRHSDIDWESGHIIVREPKNGEARFVPLNDTARSALAQALAESKGPHVFTGKSGYPYNFRKSFETARRRAGLRDFRFHDLRHDFGSRLAMAGVDLNTVRELLGHKSLRMTLRYSHLSRGHMSRAVSRLCEKTNPDAQEDLLYKERSQGDVSASPASAFPEVRNFRGATGGSFSDSEVNTSKKGG